MTEKKRVAKAGNLAPKNYFFSTNFLQVFSTNVNKIPRIAATMENKNLLFSLLKMPNFQLIAYKFIAKKMMKIARKILYNVVIIWFD